MVCGPWHVVGDLFARMSWCEQIRDLIVYFVLNSFWLTGTIKNLCMNLMKIKYLIINITVCNKRILWYNNAVFQWGDWNASCQNILSHNFAIRALNRLLFLGVIWSDEFWHETVDTFGGHPLWWSHSMDFYEWAILQDVTFIHNCAIADSIPS